MHNRPTEAHLKNYRLILNQSYTHRHLSHQYEHRSNGSKSSSSFSILLALPSETLTHVTSFLDPPSLFSLAGTNKSLYDHVKDDNTWHRAFLCRFLGIGPEGDPHDGNSLMLRRSETTWKKEFVVRYNLTRRWHRSRTTTISHTPHDSTISRMHLMSENALLTSSLQYGIVSRSIPLTGKILRGFLDAAGTLNGIGIGNPNAEFSPNVAACALTSDGGTAKIAWGFTNGEVAVTTANKAMDAGSRAGAKLVKCKVGDLHEGVVDNVIWDNSIIGQPAVVTGCADGRVKVWDAKTVKCLWTSEKANLVLPDPCVRVASDLANGNVAALMRSGNVIVWSGFAHLLAESHESVLLPSVKEVRVASLDGLPAIQNYVSAALFLDSETAAFTGRLSLLTCRDTCHSFDRLNIDLGTGHVERIRFGEATTGYIRCIYPSFASQSGESSFIIVGDELGCVSIYDWNAQASPATSRSSPSAVSAIRKFEAHDDGPVTALAWNTVVLATGSSTGALKIWDSLTFTCLRTLAISPPRGLAEPVSQIILERDMIVASIGSRALAFKAERVGRDDKSKGKKVKRNGKRGDTAKWREQFELYRDIDESRRAHEEQQGHIRRTFGREKEQRTTLEGLGLNELEALEYVLMLSRDEEQQRRMNNTLQSPSSLPAVEDEGVFEGDFDDLPVPVTNGNASSSSVIYDVPSSSSSLGRASASPPSSWNSSVMSNGRSWPRTSPSSSNVKVQVSPRFRPEPMEAGFSITPLNIGGSSLPLPMRVPVPPLIGDQGHFPIISPSPSSTGTSVPSTPGTGLSSSMRKSVSSSPESYRNAWSTPLSRSVSSSDAVPSPGSSPQGARVAVRQAGPSLLAADLARHAGGGSSAMQEVPRLDATPEDIEDEELRYAIEISLAEARSRGEVV